MEEQLTIQPVIKKLRKKTKSPKAELTGWEYNPPVYFYERLVPKSAQELDNIGRELVNWARRDDSLVLSSFFSERIPPINMQDAYTFAERSEGLKEGIKMAKQMLAARRENGAIHYKLNFQAIKETQPLYDPEYRAWKLEAIKSTADHIDKIVIMPEIPRPKGE